MDSAVNVQGLVKRFGALEAVGGVSFQVARGEIFGILGPNGAGKTTTLECIEGLQGPSAGRALVAPVAGLYLVFDRRDALVYVGESSDIQARYATHSATTYFSALRRNLGTVILGFQLLTVRGRKRYFTESQDAEVSKYLGSCKIATLPIRFGRYELEEYLIQKYKPLLNRKSKA